MKHLKQFLLLVGLILCCNGCDKENTKPFPPIVAPGPSSSFLVNESGHRIAIVSETPGTIHPDSLVIDPSCVAEIHYKMYYGYEEYDEIKMYYDERYLIRIKQLPLSRKFTLPRYVYKDKEGEWLPTFTFLEKDYLYAVEHGIDLQTTE